jgi:putative transcriptional regulator
MPARNSKRLAPERGQRIAQARTEAGYTQAQLSERIGIGRVTLARLETGVQSPSLDVALALSRELGQSVETLFREVD